MNSIKYYFYYLDTQFSGFPLIIRITVFVVMILVAMYVVSLLRFFFIARHIRKEDKRRAKIKKRYAERFNDILFTDENVSISKIRSDLNFKEEDLKDWEKKYISDLIVEIIRTKEDEIEYK